MSEQTGRCDSPQMHCIFTAGHVAALCRVGREQRSTYSLHLQQKPKNSGRHGVNRVREHIINPGDAALAYPRLRCIGTYTLYIGVIQIVYLFCAYLYPPESMENTFRAPVSAHLYKLTVLPFHVFLIFHPLEFQTNKQVLVNQPTLRSSD